MIDSWITQSICDPLIFVFRTRPLPFRSAQTRLPPSSTPDPLPTHTHKTKALGFSQPSEGNLQHTLKMSIPLRRLIVLLTFAKATAVKHSLSFLYAKSNSMSISVEHRGLVAAQCFVQANSDSYLHYRATRVYFLFWFSLFGL